MMATNSRMEDAMPAIVVGLRGQQRVKSKKKSTSDFDHVDPVCSRITFDFRKD